MIFFMIRIKKFESTNLQTSSTRGRRRHERRGRRGERGDRAEVEVGLGGGGGEQDARGADREGAEGEAQVEGGAPEAARRTGQGENSNWT